MAEGPLRALRPWRPRLPHRPGPGSPLLAGEGRLAAGRFPAALRAFLDEEVPAVEPLGRWGAYLDLTGCDRLHPRRGVLLGAIARRHREGPISAGEASTRLGARLAAAVTPPRAWWSVQPGQEAAFLAPFPLACLREELPGPVMELQRLGLGCLGEAAALPEDLVRAALGGEGLLLWKEARGQGRRDVRAEVEARRLALSLSLIHISEPTRPY